MIDRTILSLSRSKLEFRKLGDRLEGDPGRAAVRRFAGRHARRGARRSSTRSRRLGEHGHGYHVLRAETTAEQDALTEGPQGRARAC